MRAKFWARADDSSIEKWTESTEYYRRYLWEECFGKLPAPSEPLSAETRKIYDETSWAGYEVVIPLWPEVFAYGILLMPKGLRSGERRPVVVCQHGSGGRPQDLIKPTKASAEYYYRRYAATLADHGFIVYCPQNMYFGHNFQVLQKLANPLKLSLFSFILSQHDRTLDWLSTLPNVDASRIAFYGLSYGGKTAARVPPILKRCPVDRSRPLDDPAHPDRTGMVDDPLGPSKRSVQASEQHHPSRVSALARTSFSPIFLSFKR